MFALFDYSRAAGEMNMYASPLLKQKDVRRDRHRRAVSVRVRPTAPDAH